MKTLRNFHFIYFSLFFLFLLPSIRAQDNDCGTQDELTSLASNGNFIGGYLKPQRTDLTNGNPAPSNATFNIILVFIRFKNDNYYEPDWPAGSSPYYMNNLLATTKNISGDFWNRYSSSTELLSDYYQEVSRGTMHVTGIARYIETDYNNSDYRPTWNGGLGYDALLEEIYGKLKNDLSIHWLDFDQWKQGSTDGNFEYFPDGHIDMMGLIFRRDSARVSAAPGAAGYVPLGGPSEYLIDPRKS
ncbi:MAG: hypothetical protein JST55_10240 [Bacteroidetes bacterium]|nr:hypothetical protein [Bacteroidota bacterium]